MDKPKKKKEQTGIDISSGMAPTRNPNKQAKLMDSRASSGGAESRRSNSTTDPSQSAIGVTTTMTISEQRDIEGDSPSIVNSLALPKGEAHTSGGVSQSQNLPDMNFDRDALKRVATEFAPRIDSDLPSRPHNYQISQIEQAIGFERVKCGTTNAADSQYPFFFKEGF